MIATQSFPSFRIGRRQNKQNQRRERERKERKENKNRSKSNGPGVGAAQSEKGPIDFRWPSAGGREVRHRHRQRHRRRPIDLPPAPIRRLQIASFGFHDVTKGIPPILGSFTSFYLALPSFTGFYLILPSFTGFYRVLPGFTGFYLVLPSFS